jgi:phosphate uptake regulator
MRETEILFIGLLIGFAIGATVTLVAGIHKYDNEVDRINQQLEEIFADGERPISRAEKIRRGGL